MTRDNLHLSQHLGRHRCTCGEKASRLMRCRIAGCVIARCGTHGASMARVREEHEAGCQAPR